MYACESVNKMLFCSKNVISHLFTIRTGAITLWTTKHDQVPPEAHTYVSLAAVDKNLHSYRAKPTDQNGGLEASRSYKGLHGG